LHDGVGDQIDDHLAAHQRAAAPVLGGVANHAMFDLIPLADAAREMTNVVGIRN